jgi:DNA-binding response OmpR family regulator
MIQSTVRVLVVGGERHIFFEQLSEHAELCSHQWKIELDYVETGKEALGRLVSFSPSVIMLDAHLSDMNSMELLEELKEKVGPVIVTSESHSPTIESSARERGAIAYILVDEHAESYEGLFERLSVECAVPPGAEYAH